MINRLLFLFFGLFATVLATYNSLTSKPALYWTSDLTHENKHG